MENLSEVIKILDGALKANASMAANYAGLLADKLEAVGERRQAATIRERLARAPLAVASAQDGSLVSMGSLPVDGESRLHTVDVSSPTSSTIRLLLPDAIERRLNEFVDVIEHHERLARAGASMPARLLLYGPPGTGKTQAARWLAARLNFQLLTVRCDTLVSSLLGQTSRNLRRVMDYAQERRCVLFLDEFDALAGARGNERDVGELQRVVIALLQNIDALSEETILVAATNHESLLDPAVWRRFSFRIPMPYPEPHLRAQMWKEFLGDFAPSSISFEDLALVSEMCSGALIEQVCLDSKRGAVIAGLDSVDKIEVYRRLGLALALNKGVILSTTDSEIRWLKTWQPQQFPLRELARVYNVSVRHVGNILKREISNGSIERKRRPS